MSDGPGARRALDLARELGRVVAEFAAREEKVDRDARTGALVAGRECSRGLEAVAAWREQALAEVSSQFAAERERVESVHVMRMARIRDAYRSARRQLTSGLERVKGNRITAIQMRMMLAERAREEALSGLQGRRDERERRVRDLTRSLSGARLGAAVALSGSWIGLARLLGATVAPPAGETPPDAGADERIGAFEGAVGCLEADLARFRKHLVAQVFRFLPLPLAPALAGGAVHVFSAGGAVIAAWGVAGAVALVQVVLGIRAGASAGALIGSLGRAERARRACCGALGGQPEEDRARIEEEYRRACASLDAEWTDDSSDGREGVDERIAKLEAQVGRLSDAEEERHRARLAAMDEEEPVAIERVRVDATVQGGELELTRERALARVEGARVAEWARMEGEWGERVGGLYREILELGARVEAGAPEWGEAFVRDWQAPGAFPEATRFGSLEIDLERLAGRLPRDARLALPGPARISVPLALDYRGDGSILIETGATGRDDALGALNAIVLNLLATAPSGKLGLTVIDPVGLGESFAGVMHLSDYGSNLIDGRIWTQRSQIEERLAELGEHIEKVIQMYLRDEYATIAEYNERAGEIAEKIHFLVVADFPSNFSDEAARRLMSIAASGPRCGVHTLIHWDRRVPVPLGLVEEDLRSAGVTLRGEGGGFVCGEDLGPGGRISLDAPPPPALASDLVHRVGRSSVDADRVEVPFSEVAPDPVEFWSGDTAEELRVAVGRTGATKLQELAIGKGTRQHALIAGKTGSGKSTLFHVIITNLSLWCGPDEVEFYLVDFKKGVEFKCYGTRRLPHARVVAVESDREFGLSVLERVDEELRRRGELYRRLGVQDLAGYRRAAGALPRCLLIIDEFQEFFVEDDRIFHSASVLLDRIVRQGRAFGIHVLLGSQTLGGAYTLARPTLGQMVIRVALQCNEADAALIMEDGNPAPRFLSRPGEGIYNDRAGALEGNSPFQVVWLPEEERDGWLERVRLHAERGGFGDRAPVVFEGNMPADVRDNAALRALLESGAGPARGPARIWLGAPNSIKGPTEVVFRRQSGANLLIVGQREDAVLALFGIAIVTLAAQDPSRRSRMIVLDASAPDSSERRFLERVAGAIPGGIELCGPGDAARVMEELAGELARRRDIEEDAGEAGAPVYLFVLGLQRQRKLRQEDDFGFGSSGGGEGVSPGARLGELICEGPRLGIHVIASADTFNAVNRAMSRKALSECEMRVLFQMSANDSASLVDSPRASALGLHRALYHDEHEGYAEVFRPYASPGEDWIEAAERALLARGAGGGDQGPNA